MPSADAIATSCGKTKPIVRMEIMRQFTPTWFTATMGTGITALAINQLSLAIPGLHAISTALWLFNILLFVFSALYAARWNFFFEGASRIFAARSCRMFFGAVPTGLATNLIGFIVFGPDLFGIGPSIANRDSALVDRHGDVGRLRRLHPVPDVHPPGHSIDKMTAVWLLPVVSAEVAAASAGLLVPPSPNRTMRCSS